MSRGSHNIRYQLYRSSSLTLCFGFVGGHEPLPPYGSVTPESHEHPVSVGRQGDVVGPPGTECGEEGGGGVWAAINLKQSEKLGVLEFTQLILFCAGVLRR